MGSTTVLPSRCAVTCAAKAKVAEGLRRRGVEFKTYEWRTAARVLDEQELKRVQHDVQLEIATEQADLVGDEEKAIDLASKSVLRQQMAEEEQIVPAPQEGYDGDRPAQLLIGPGGVRASSARRATAMKAQSRDEEVCKNAKIRMR